MPGMEASPVRFRIICIRTWYIQSGLVAKNYFGCATNKSEKFFDRWEIVDFNETSVLEVHNETKD